MLFDEKVGKFLDACENDTALQAFARKRPMSLRFLIPDQELEFSLVFKDGSVRAAQGSLVDPADLEVKTDSETFDGVMSGCVNGASAYMTGKLRFRGETMKGMAMQRITKDMVRLWSQL